MANNPTRIMCNTPPRIPLHQAGLGIDIDTDIDIGTSSPRSTLPGSSTNNDGAVVFSKPSLQPLAIPMLSLERASSWPMKNSPTLSPANNSGNKDAASLTSPLPPLSPISPFASSGWVSARDKIPIPRVEEQDATYLETRHLHVAYADAPNRRFRPTMEDKVVITPLRCGGTFVGVYDGHGGRWVADHAGETLHKHFESYMESNANNRSNTTNTTTIADMDIDSVIGASDEEKAFRHAYETVDEELRIQRALQIGSTAVTCYFDPKGRYVACANAGDSRCVIGDAKGKARRLTVDHRPLLHTERARINEGGSFVCGGRVNGILAISRALGDHAMKSVVIPTPHTVTHIINHVNDRFAIVACDGLWDVVDDAEACLFVRKIIAATRRTGRRDNNSNSNIDPAIISKEAANALVQLALEKGSTDNVSVVVVLLKQ